MSFRCWRVSKLKVKNQKDQKILVDRTMLAKNYHILTIHAESHRGGCEIFIATILLGL